MPRVDLREVERRWEAMVAANPAFFDGRLLHVRAVVRNGHGGATLHVAECAYRHWAVGLPDLLRRFHVADPAFDTGVRALGVKGLVIAEGAVLVGRRGPWVAAYPDCWEFAPGGGLEPGWEPRAMLERELLEETGIRCGREARMSSVALLLDGSIRSWEIVQRVHLERRVDLTRAEGEYTALRWVPLERIATAVGSRAGMSEGAATPTERHRRELLAEVCGGPVTDCAALMVPLLTSAEALTAP